MVLILLILGTTLLNRVLCMSLGVDLAAVCEMPRSLVERTPEYLIPYVFNSLIMCFVNLI